MQGKATAIMCNHAQTGQSIRVGFAMFHDPLFDPFCPVSPRPSHVPLKCNPFPTIYYLPTLSYHIYRPILHSAVWPKLPLRHKIPNKQLCCRLDQGALLSFHCKMEDWGSGLLGTTIGNPVVYGNCGMFHRVDY